MVRFFFVFQLDPEFEHSTTLVDLLLEDGGMEGKQETLKTSATFTESQNH